MEHLTALRTAQPNHPIPHHTRSANRFDIRGIHRWPLGTPYPRIVADLKEWFTLEPLRKYALIVDRTGLGRGIYDMIAGSGITAVVRPYSITCGNKPGDRTVPKVDLVGAVVAAMETRRLHFPHEEDSELPPVLQQESRTFREKITSDRNETFSSSRDRDHDDLVLALAPALWYAGRRGDGVVISMRDIPPPEKSHLKPIGFWA